MLVAIVPPRFINFQFRRYPAICIQQHNTRSNTFRKFMSSVCNINCRRFQILGLNDLIAQPVQQRRNSQRGT